MPRIRKYGTSDANRSRPRMEALEARRLLSVWSDFNGDGYADLAIGVPEEDLDLVNDAGAFHVIFGTGTGLRAANDQFFTQDTSGVPDNADGRERFGFSLAAGDFTSTSASAGTAEAAPSPIRPSSVADQ